MGLIELTTQIKAPIEIFFDLSRSMDLHRITSAKSKEKAIAGVTSGLIKGGEFVTWRAKYFGIWQELTTQITEYNPTEFFHFKMLKGAFRNFFHQHIFEMNGEYTHMIDKVIIEYPYGVFGKIACVAFIDRYMKKNIMERNQVIKDVVESGRWREINKFYMLKITGANEFILSNQNI